MSGGDTLLYALISVCIILVLLPPCADPAIKWKEFNERWSKTLERKRDEDI